MHYIDQDLIELELPDDWDETVEDAKAYVNSKQETARTTALAEAQNKGLGVSQTKEYILKEIDKARKKAIGDKNIWSKLNNILAKQSNSKCWYCETKEDRSDNPIDHFRPKNKVVECDAHPGYWWLAFDWRNYRFTCTYCNSRRIDIETAGGKHDHFPLLQPAVWDMCDTDCNNEKPTLLDPCDIDDCSLLTFNINGSASAITEDKTLEEYIRAVTSIELYHLNYYPTKRARRIIYFKIKKLVTETNELINRGISENLDQIKAKKKELMNMIRYACPDTKFNSTARIYLRLFNNHAWVMNILQKV